MNNDIKTLATKLHITFQNLDLIENAFAHRSYLNESKKFHDSNERLEYLGDAVLELATSHFLYNQYPDYQEGMLTNLRASLVRTESLAQVAQTLTLDRYLLMSKGEESTGGRRNTSILANTMEAFLGALYLDQGYDVCVKLLEEHLFPNITEILTKATYKDNKSLLQEIAQSRFKETPYYEVVSEEGPDHNKLFTVAAYIGNTKYETGTGKSKQEAQEAAARATLEMIGHS
jgi:ribonuclease III